MLSRSLFITVFVSNFFSSYSLRYNARNISKFILENDILIADDSPNLLKNSVKSDSSYIWRDGIIPYFLDASSIDDRGQKIVFDVIQFIEKETCLNFKPYDKLADANYLFIADLGGHSRFDRDEHITINLSNVDRKHWSQFDKRGPDETDLLTQYDYKSILHYNAFAWALDKNIPTIRSKKFQDEVMEIGQSNTFSELDVLKVNKLYKCDKKLSAKSKDLRSDVILRQHVKSITARSTNSVDEIDDCPRSQQFCDDSNPACSVWAAQGWCELMPGKMLVECKKSCCNCLAMALAANNGLVHGTSGNDKERFSLKLEIGHESEMLNVGPYPPIGTHTHRWTVFVRGPNETSLDSNLVQKVVFQLHEDFPNPRRCVMTPPFEVTETGYAGFTIPLYIYFVGCRKEYYLEYDMNLRYEPRCKTKEVKILEFKDPKPELKAKLLKAGAEIISGKNSKHTSTAPSESFASVFGETICLKAASNDHHHHPSASKARNTVMKAPSKPAPSSTKVEVSKAPSNTVINKTKIPNFDIPHATMQMDQKPRKPVSSSSAFSTKISNDHQQDKSDVNRSAPSSLTCSTSGPKLTIKLDQGHKKTATVAVAPTSKPIESPLPAKVVPINNNDLALNGDKHKREKDDREKEKKKKHKKHKDKALEQQKTKNEIDNHVPANDRPKINPVGHGPAASTSKTSSAASQSPLFCVASPSYSPTQVVESTSKAGDKSSAHFDVPSTKNQVPVPSNEKPKKRKKMNASPSSDDKRKRPKNRSDSGLDSDFSAASIDGRKYSPSLAPDRSPVSNHCLDRLNDKKTVTISTDLKNRIKEPASVHSKFDNSNGEQVNSAPPSRKSPSSPISEERLQKLLSLQRKIMTLDDENLAQRVVDVLSNGRGNATYWCTEENFEFDLFSLENDVVERLFAIFPVLAQPSSSANISRNR